MTRVLVAALGVLFLAQNPPAQPPAAQPPGQPPAGQQQQPRPPVFRTGTNQVRVDVTVTDRKGEPVTNLAKEDFEVLEDGAPQKIETIKLVEANGEAPDDDTSLEIRSPEHAAVEAARDDIRVFVIFWDEYHVGQLIPATRARQALTTFVQTAFGPTDLVAIIDQLTPTDAIHFTRDHQELAEQVRQLKGRMGVYVPARSAMEEAQLSRGAGIEYIRSQVTASALEATIAFLGNLKEGRKSILFVSETIGRLGPSVQDTFEWLASAIRTANANNTSIYTLDPRGLDMNSRTSDVLLSLAGETGGKQFSSNYPGAALKEIVRNASAFYLLGYTSAKNPVDGKFHKIAVRVKRSGLEVKARTGYFAPSLAEMDTAKRKAAANTAPPDIKKALEPLVESPHTEAAGDLWAGAMPGAGGAPRVSVSWAPHAGAKTEGIWLRASTDDGHVYFDGPLRGGRAAFDAVPGLLLLRRQIIEADGTRTDRQESSLNVPDFANAPLTISTPALFRASTPLELRALQYAADPVPFAGRQFDRTDRLFVRFGVFGRSAADATVTVHLLSRQGSALAALPIKPRDGGYELDLPVGSVARGEYVLSIDASHGADQAKALISFRVN